MSFQCLSPAEQEVIAHFKTNHVLLPAGRVTLPKIPDAPPFGESRHQAVNRYMANERSIPRKGTYKKFQGVIQEYLDMGHAKLVPSSEIIQPVGKIYYFPMHADIYFTHNNTYCALYTSHFTSPAATRQFCRYSRTSSPCYSF